VSVYAFSIENFRRPKEEVDALMELMKKGLLEISQHGYVRSFNSSSILTLSISSDILERYSVRVTGIGKTELLPADVLDVLRRVEEMTKHHKK